MKAVALLLLAATSAPAEWSEARRDVVARLAERDVGEWARELHDRPLPSDEQGLVIRFQVLLRAGQLDRLPPVIDALACFQSDDPIRELIERGCLDLARRALERFDRVERDTVERFLRSCDEGIEPWLAARAAANDVFLDPWFSFHASIPLSGFRIEMGGRGPAPRRRRRRWTATARFAASVSPSERNARKTRNPVTSLSSPHCRADAAGPAQRIDRGDEPPVSGL